MTTKTSAIFCYGCQTYTKTISPLILKRFCETKIKIEGCCEKCLKGKSKIYVDSECYPLPKEIYNFPIGHLFINTIILDNISYTITDIFNDLINPNTDNLKFKYKQIALPIRI